MTNGRGGAAEVVDSVGRSKRYQVAERIYSIYHVMRRRSGMRPRLEGLIEFMAHMYRPEELLRCVGWIAQEACGLPPSARAEHLIALDSLVRRCEDGGFLSALGQAPEAEASLRGALEGPLDGPAVALIWRGLAMILGKGEERLDECVDAYRRSIELHPTIDAYQGLGDLLRGSMKRPSEAEEAYRKLLELAPHHPSAMCRVGRLIGSDESRRVEAEDWYRSWAEALPDSVDATLHLAGWLLRSGDAIAAEEARGLVAKCVDLGPKDWPDHVHLVDLMDRTELAPETIASVAGRYQEGTEGSALAQRMLHTARALSCSQRADVLELARGFCSDARRIDPEGWCPSPEEIEIQIGLQDWAAAVAVLQALAADPRHVWRHLGELIPVMTRVGAFAPELLLEALDALPAEAGVWPMIVALRLDLGRESNAPVEVAEVAKDLLDDIRNIRAEADGDASVAGSP